MSPIEECRRLLLNQLTHSTIASSAWATERQVRSAISSVLKESTKLSARALSYASPSFGLGAACQLGVTREALARALATPESRERFSERYDIGDPELARAIRAGLVRAVDDAEEAGALSPFLAVPLRESVQQIPLDQAIDLIQDARTLLEQAQSFFGPAQGLLDQFLP